ncbi:MAG: aminotransferase class III-fold pyridoxal phosphate-dependent enzyme [Prevotellaceae bacterium]|jgi:acetylornithine aminotransferase|nr:aminotransferase class III-fold pyridoxal phosphate-dependent enzyme [Prevotellaceae bacterium]
MKLFDVYPLFPIEIVSGKGCKVYDNEGVEYLDMYGGHAVISVGHAHPAYVKAISQQVAKLGFYSNSIINKLQENFAGRLGKICGYDDYALFLINSGAEANENALKLASFHNGKKKVLSFKKSFHGRTSAAVKVTDNPNYVSPVNAGLEVFFAELNDIEIVKKELATGEYSSVIVEGIQGVGGIMLPDDQFLRELRQLCTDNNVVLILDEIQSGYGRTGKFFAHQYADVRADIITVAKGIANGFPMAGVIISPMFKAVYGQLGTTFGGNHLACAAAISVLDIFEQENLIENARVAGDFLMQELSQFSQIKEIRGRGLMIGMEFSEPIKEIRTKLLFEQKVFTGVAGTNTIRLLPPLSLSIEEAKDFIQRLKAVL